MILLVCPTLLTLRKTYIQWFAPQYVRHFILVLIIYCLYHYMACIFLETKLNFAFSAYFLFALIYFVFPLFLSYSKRKVFLYILMRNPYMSQPRNQLFWILQWMNQSRKHLVSRRLNKMEDFKWNKSDKKAREWKSGWVLIDELRSINI